MKCGMICLSQAAQPPVLNGRIGRATQLVTMKANDENYFLCSFCVCMGKDFQKSALSTFLYFVRVRAEHQLHMRLCINI